jgi:hypothetical protein
MLYALKAFFKSHLRKDSYAWILLREAQRPLERLHQSQLRLQRMLSGSRIQDLNQFEQKIYSQNGEDGILQEIFTRIGTHQRHCVEFGVGDGTERLTRLLYEQGWTGLLMDPADHNPSFIQREFVTADNINALFQKYDVPSDFDLLCIDIDGNDYWVWKALDTRYSPRVVVIEYNAKIPPHESKTIAYEPTFRWDGSDYFGASLLALTKLATLKGYVLVACDRAGVNAFFVRKDCLNDHFVIKPLEQIYQPPRYGMPQDHGGWPASSRTMIQV